MNNPNKITYYDLKLEIKAKRVPQLLGRSDEIARLSRVVNSNLHNNCLVVGPSGIGKSVLVSGWLTKLAANLDFKNTRFIQIDVENFYGLINNPNLLARYEEAFENIGNCIMFIDDFGQLSANKPALQSVKRLLAQLLENPKVKVVLNLKPHELKLIEEEYPTWSDLFEIIQLRNQPFSEQVAILKYWLVKLTIKSKISSKESDLELLVKYADRFSSLGQLPQSSIRILDESISEAKVRGQSSLSAEGIMKVVSDKTGVPLSNLNSDELQKLRHLESDLNQSIVGQTDAIKKISSSIQRAKLGLKNPNRPLASFLILGPSGVGKTETAKLLAQTVFGKKENFTRIDMSEFGQEHTVQRLIGAPPGYVGYDDGGGLTNIVKAEPYSLILLDEIEKAHPKVFDVFLQILDDGRLTSGQGQTVDFSQTIIMSTSNLAVDAILSGFTQGEDIHSTQFLQAKIMPLLTKAFRLEFLNRFDSIIVFKPLDSTDLTRIASLEIRKIEQRMTNHKIKFNFDETKLTHRIQSLLDNRFGARPVKRFVEELCESVITKALLK